MICPIMKVQIMPHISWDPCPGVKKCAELRHRVCASLPGCPRDNPNDVQTRKEFFLHLCARHVSTEDLFLVRVLSGCIHCAIVQASAQAPKQETNALHKGVLWLAHASMC